AVKEHGGDEAPVFAALQRSGKDRAELRQLVVVVLGVDRGLVEPDQRDDDEQRHRQRGAALHRLFSSIAETRRIRRCANRGNISFIRMYRAAASGTMRRWRPSSAESTIARATRSGLTAGISREAPGILPRSARVKNSESVVPGQTRATRTPRPMTSSRSASVKPMIA